MLMSPVSLTVSKLTSAIAAVSSSAVLTSFAVSFPPINDVKAVSGWGSDTFPSGWGSDTSPSGWGSDTFPSGWGSDTFPSGWGSDTSPSGWGSDTSPSGCTAASSAGWAHFAQFSGKAPSAPQMGQSAFIASAVQAVSQLQTGGSSVSLSANAVVGTRQSTMHRASRILNNRFFILFPPFRRSLTA